MKRAGVLLAGLLLALGLAAPSSAATKTVHLTVDGPVPATLTLKPGDRVVFVNDDTVPHQVRSQGGWQYDSGPVPPSRTSSATPALTAPGSYAYSDVRSIVILPTTFTGRLVVPKPAPKPTPTPKPTQTATSTPTPKPTQTATPRPTQTSTPQPTQTPTQSPTPEPTPEPTQSPTASTSPTAAPSPTSTPQPRYGDPRALVQSSPHRYGLPALLAGVAIGGVLSLLVRVLLSLPAGRRTGSG